MAEESNVLGIFSLLLDLMGVRDPEADLPRLLSPLSNAIRLEVDNVNKATSLGEEYAEYVLDDACSVESL